MIYLNSLITLMTEEALFLWKILRNNQLNQWLMHIFTKWKQITWASFMIALQVKMDSCILILMKKVLQMKSKIDWIKKWLMKHGLNMLFSMKTINLESFIILKILKIHTTIIRTTTPRIIWVFSNSWNVKFTWNMKRQRDVFYRMTSQTLIMKRKQNINKNWLSIIPFS